MHGGILATLIDSTTILSSMIGPRHLAGLSLDLSVQYLKAVNVEEHEKLVCESVVEKAGNRIFFTSCKVKSLDESQVFAIGHHTFAVDPKVRGIFTKRDFEDCIDQGSKIT